MLVGMQVPGAFAGFAQPAFGIKLLVTVFVVGSNTLL